MPKPFNNTVKKCLTMRAMLPGRFPDAYDQLRHRLLHISDHGFSPKLVDCTCSKDRRMKCGTQWNKAVPEPTKAQVAAFTEKALTDPSISQLVVDLWSVPVKKPVS
jgi:hypothetical protein